MALGVLWLILRVMVLALFVARLWTTLPRDVEYRRQLARWLADLFVAMLCYAVWQISSRTGRASAVAPFAPGPDQRPSRP